MALILFTFAIIVIAAFCPQETGDMMIHSLTATVVMLMITEWIYILIAAKKKKKDKNKEEDE